MKVRRIALLGTYPPRQCGIAIFTDDLAHALVQARPDAEVLVIGMNDGQAYPYPARVRLTIDQDNLATYEAAADALNDLDIDVLAPYNTSLASSAVPPEATCLPCCDACARLS